MTEYYNDTEFSYDRYWQHRQYEHQSEVLAIKRLLKNKKFANSCDLGGGFGRLTRHLTNYSENITLVEPSQKMRAMAQKYLADIQNIKIIAGNTEKTTLPLASQNLVLSVRVMHHIPELNNTFTELSKIIKPNGLLVLEFANSLNIKARIRSWFSGHPITRIPLDLRSRANVTRQSIPFVNHHPDVILQELTTHNFIIKRKLSVSNLRSPFLKKFVPLPALIALEYLLQIPLSWLYFGPSIFILAQKVDI